VRQLLYTALMANATLQEEIENRLYERSALGKGDIPAQPKPPYLLYGGEANSVVREIQDTAKAQHQFFRLTAYDEAGDYLRIERMLRLVRDTLLTLSGQVSPSGLTCMGVWWTATSEDGVDVETGYNLMYSIYRFTTNG
jgi:hypothetical protein